MGSSSWPFFLSSPEEFWRDNVYGGWATAIVMLFLVIWQLTKKRVPVFSSGSSATPTTSNAAISGDAVPPGNSGSSSSISGRPHIRALGIVSDADLKNLIDNLEERLAQDEKFEHVIDKRNNLMSYSAKCCKPKDGPLKYLSVTVFENCSAEILRDFYMDSDYRKEWDKTFVDHEQLQLDEADGIEIGRMVKKFPLLTPREYVLAWKLWEGEGKTFYCFIKECEHPLAPRQRKYVRVGFFRSGWRIRKVPGRDACEIKMVHQEDAGLNTEMAKLAFAKRIWSYVCKMDDALRRYPSRPRPQTSSALTAVNLIKKVPPEFDTTNGMSSSSSATETQILNESNSRKLFRKPSRKTLAKGLVILGGVICMSRGHSGLGAKVAMAYILTKLRKRQPSSNPGSQS